MKVIITGHCKFIGLQAVIAMLAAAIASGIDANRSALGAEPSGQRYTIVEAEATSMLVADNKTKTVYYYASLPGQKPGDDLHLRGMANLKVIGKPRIDREDAKPANSNPMVPGPVDQERPKPRYTIEESDGVSLVVIDNGPDTAYFYSIEPGEKPGADLHLCWSLDLNDVGKLTIKLNLPGPKR